MTFSIRHETILTPYLNPFRIARTHGDGGGATSVILELRDDADGPAGGAGPVGFGEGYPDAYYGETPATMAVVLPMLVAAIEPLADGLRGDVAAARTALVAAGAAMDDAIRHHGAAKCALDIALHDLVGKRLGIPVHELLEMSPDIPPTDFTLGLDEPSVVAARAKRAAHFPALKIKVGGPSDMETLRAVRSVFGGPIRIDANTAWEP